MLAVVVHGAAAIALETLLLPFRRQLDGLTIGAVVAAADHAFDHVAVDRHLQHFFAAMIFRTAIVGAAVEVLANIVGGVQHE